MTILDQVAAEGRADLTPDEALTYLAEQTHKHFGLSVEDFIRKAENGTLPEGNPMSVHLAILTGARLKSCD